MLYTGLRFGVAFPRPNVRYLIPRRPTTVERMAGAHTYGTLLLTNPFDHFAYLEPWVF